ncbi:MAG: hypothetical protein IPG06_25765 [Haliea sp.]|nr:hypothetical protein [Haliea sp.]
MNRLRQCTSPHLTPRDLERWHRTCGANVFFDQAIAKVIYPKNVLALPILDPDPLSTGS